MTKFRTSKARLVVVVLPVVTLGVLAVSPKDVVDAHLSGPTNQTTCDANNRIEPEVNVAFFYNGLNIENVEAANWTRLNTVDPTDVNTSAASSSTSADVVVEDADYSTYCGFTWHSSPGGGIVGLARCNALWAGPYTGYCDRFGVYIDTSFTTTTTVTNRRALAGHEFGHTLGALHETGTTVMVQGYPKPTTAYGTHVTLEINNAFP